MEVGKKMRAALSGYLAEVNAVLDTLGEAEKVAEVLSEAINRNQEISAQIEDAIREIAHLQGQREELYQDFANASFEQDTERLEMISDQRDSIDQRVTSLEENIEDLRSKIADIDRAAVAEMLESIEQVQLPIFCSGSIQWGQTKIMSGGYSVIPPSGLVGELFYAHRSLVTEVAERKRHVRELAPWYQYASKQAVPA